MRLGPVKCCGKVSFFFNLAGRNASSNDRFQTPLFGFFACFVLFFLRVVILSLWIDIVL